MSLEALADKGCVDSGQLRQWRWTMTNKNISLASESDGDVFVGTIPSWVTHWGGSGESSFGSKTKLFEKVFSQEFRILKLFLKIPGFHFFLNPSFPPKVLCDITPAKYFFENGGLLANSSVCKFDFGF